MLLYQPVDKCERKTKIGLYEGMTLDPCPLTLVHPAEP